MATEEYLSNFRPDLLNGNIDQMLAANQPQDRTTLIEYLRQALENLKTDPGPHLEFRRENADDWIGWWVRFLEKKKDTDRGKLVPFEKIKSSLKKDEKYGVLFAGGFEGHGGHRFAATWIGCWVSPILLLERDWYIESKERGGPYLDLRARVSMWVHYNPRILVSVLPEKPKEVDDNTHYKDLFDKTGADYCFASRADPYREEKFRRGKYAPFLEIPDRYVQSTTDKVEKLAPDIDLGDLPRMINTTDDVRRAFPRRDMEELRDLIARTKL